MLDAQIGPMVTAAGATSLAAAGVLISGGTRTPAERRTFHQVLTGTGALTSAYTIEGSNDEGATWVVLYTNAAFNGTASVTDKFSIPTTDVWGMYRVNLSAITGTNAKFKSFVAEQRS